LILNTNFPQPPAAFKPLGKWAKHDRLRARQQEEKEPTLTTNSTESAAETLAQTEADEPSGETLLPGIITSLEDDKAQDIVTIDLKGKSAMADAMVVCSGRSQRHVSAMADHLLRKLKETGLGRAQVEGLPHADWVLIDAGDVVVHLFRPEVRDFYKIERMWSVELPTDSPA